MDIKLNPAYIPLVQKPTCCAVTCLQMLLYRNGFGLHDQEELAITFGVKIHPEHASAFSKAMPIMTKSNYDEGIQTVESENHINTFLQAKAPTLCAKSFKHSQVKNLADFLSDHLRQNHDIWVEYHTQEIHNGNSIHDGLIESFSPSKDEVIVIDPIPTRRQRFVLSLKTLEKAISTQFGRETGFIVVSKG